MLLGNIYILQYNCCWNDSTCIMTFLFIFVFICLFKMTMAVE